ncbi:uncharacterized protein LOC114270463 [Camellia sinensis]|uniref:uncharacterized protein LOC114270463 n=1 Tax=Camellia sinensis TaxID=4442 RepID=UPI001035DE4C|nr:uncharacterized protein LOC114270463 [Camellia sinensis]
MGKKETLKSYNNRYWETFNQIRDCPKNLAIARYKQGLPADNKLRDSLKMMPPLTMEALLERMHQHIKVDEDGTHAKAKSSTTVMSDKKPTTKVNTVGRKERPNKNGRGRRPNGEDSQTRRLRVHTAITMVFNKPIYWILSEIHDEPYIWQPAKLGEAQRGYDNKYRCTFHDEVGHQTENCTLLRQHLEELVVAGHLDQYIEGGAQPAPQDRNESDGMPAKGPPQGVINVIHGIIEPEQVCELREMIKKAKHLKEVLSVQPTVKTRKTEVTNIITFSNKDLARLQNPHNDGLIITLRMKNFDIKWILIDQGSSCKIMYYETSRNSSQKTKISTRYISLSRLHLNAGMASWQDNSTS